MLENKKNKYHVETDVPKEVLEMKNMFKTHVHKEKLCIQCPTWAVRDPVKMDKNSDSPGWFLYDLKTEDGMKSIYVHNSFQRNFIADENRALRDIGAFPTSTGAFYYAHRENIRNNCNKNRANPEYEEGMLADDFVGDPDIEYFVHIDLATTHDSTGICMGHVNGSFIKDGKYYPKIFIDLIYVMDPKNYGGEIMIHNVRQFITELRDVRGFKITDVSFDTWQSKDSQQLLSTDGFKTHTLSVDKTPFPHQALKEAINLTSPEDNFWVIDYYYHEKAFYELENLVFKRNTVADHSPNNSKDAADGMAGCLFLGYLLNEEKMNNFIIFEEVDFF